MNFGGDTIQPVTGKEGHVCTYGISVETGQQILHASLEAAHFHPHTWTAVAVLDGMWWSFHFVGTCLGAHSTGATSVIA